MREKNLTFLSLFGQFLIKFDQERANEKLINSLNLNAFLPIKFHEKLVEKLSK